MIMDLLTTQAESDLQGELIIPLAKQSRAADRSNTCRSPFFVDCQMRTAYRNNESIKKGPGRQPGARALRDSSCIIQQDGVLFNLCAFPRYQNAPAPGQSKDAPATKGHWAWVVTSPGGSRRVRANGGLPGRRIADSEGSSEMGVPRMVCHLRFSEQRDGNRSVNAGCVSGTSQVETFLRSITVMPHKNALPRLRWGRKLSKRPG